ncbi:hypothetical protein O6H91_17G012800 [Diphasiastrum complanatum]|uniref:Uncharacterized protein n=1 Tax=Diphasiastrum complanatum TaxID=34168 RepID=A0ACC2B480_DIPCM|nr:hypothetical protein O6H91_17G012800 [Diphasiastrum complanatum]
MAKNKDIVKRLKEILENADLDTTTPKAVRTQLEQQLGEDLSGKKVFIREHIDLFLKQRQQQQEENKVKVEKSKKLEEKVNKEGKSKGLKDQELEKVKEKEKEKTSSKRKKGASAPAWIEVDSKRVRAKIERAIKESMVKEKKKRTSGGGLNKSCSLSAELQAILGKDELPRTQVVKQLWEYIRQNNLQDPGNKRKIICDDALRALFGTDRTDMFKMNKLLSKHLWPIEDISASFRNILLLWD